MANDLVGVGRGQGKTVSEAQAHPQPTEGLATISMPVAVGSCGPAGSSAQASAADTDLGDLPLLLQHTLEISTADGQRPSILFLH